MLTKIKLNGLLDNGKRRASARRNSSLTPSPSSFTTPSLSASFRLFSLVISIYYFHFPPRPTNLSAHQLTSVFPALFSQSSLHLDSRPSPSFLPSHVHHFACRFSLSSSNFYTQISTPSSSFTSPILTHLAKDLPRGVFILYPLFHPFTNLLRNIHRTHHSTSVSCPFLIPHSQQHFVFLCCC